jgi:hypothetical protein
MMDSHCALVWLGKQKAILEASVGTRFADPTDDPRRIGTLNVASRAANVKSISRVQYCAPEEIQRPRRGAESYSMSLRAKDKTPPPPREVEDFSIPPPPI